MDSMTFNQLPFVQQAMGMQENSAQLFHQRMLTKQAMERMEQQTITTTVTEPPRLAPNIHSRLSQTMADAEQIQRDIKAVLTYLVNCELILAGEVQRYAYHALSLIKERGLYRHLMKKYANTLKHQTDELVHRCTQTDMAIVEKEARKMNPHGTWWREFFDDGGGLVNRLCMWFSQENGSQLELIRLACKQMADSLKVKDSDLLAEIMMAQALAQTDIELYEVCQKTAENIGRGRLVSHCIKSLHSEAMVNSTRNLVDHFVPRTFKCRPVYVDNVRGHIKKLQNNMSEDRMFESINACYMALRMDYIEYFLGMLRVEMEKGKNVLPIPALRMIRKRLGSMERARQAMQELLAIPMPTEDMDAWDYSKFVATHEAPCPALNSLRQLMLKEEYLEEDDTRPVRTNRVLRQMARSSENGLLSDKVIGELMRECRTKVALMDKLEEIGPEMHATWRKVKKMSAADLKKL